MGFWRKALGAGLIVAGGASGNPGLIASGAGVIGSDIQSEAAKKANQQQQASTDQAVGTIRDTYNANAANFSPYLQGGQAAFRSLGDMVGLPSLPATTTQQVSPTLPGHPALGSDSIGALGALDMDPMNDSRTAASIDARSLPTGGVMPVASNFASSYVTVKSPDGQVGQIPRAFAQKAVAAGGQLVEG